MARKRVSECCGAEVWGYGQKGYGKKYYTCSQCHFWPAKAVIAREEEDERARDDSNKLETS